MDLTPVADEDGAFAFADAGVVGRVEVVVVGAGLAGSLLALALARRGVRVAVVDPHAVHPADFRCEKLSADQAEMFEALGVGDVLAPLARRDGAPVPITEQGFRYEAAVNAARALWPTEVAFIEDRAAGVVQGPDIQRLDLAGGGAVEARLIVLATGATGKLRASLGVRRDILRARHSVCVGFSIAPKDRPAFAFDGLVHPGERAGDGVGFASLFPMGGAMRVNLFLYHDPRQALVHDLRGDPIGGLFALLPRLRKTLGEIVLVGEPEVRAIDLYRMQGAAREGVVLIGDAAGSCCPATALGVTRLLTDIRQLVELHLPVWLATPGMGVDKTAAYDADPDRQAFETQAFARADRGRLMATRTTPAWRLRRGLAALRRSARAATAPRRAAPKSTPRPTVAFARGDRVRVASAVEILATLDADGALDGMPFMPEMAAFCGAEMRVHRRAETTCVEGAGLRGLERTVLLEAARCDGAAHDGCQRGCLMFWNEAWLWPAADAPPPADPAAEVAARAILEGRPVRRDGVYLCQSTRLLTATRPLTGSGLARLTRDLRTGEIGLGRWLGTIGRATINRVRRAFGLAELWVLSGPLASPPRVTLDLKPGDAVRIKRPRELRAHLDPAARNAGLTFEPEMTTYAGQLREVDRRVERIISEATGRMVTLKRTVTLKGLTCQGLCTRNCPRANPLFWRESWLERV
jgi:2-polyprenyl-6-methoxyphenol hydroxylase-like FAD-dependent oxidoreductase